MREAARRSRELSAQIARRAIAAAERREADTNEPEALAERLRAAAGPDGRLDIDAAIEAVRGELPPSTFLQDDFRAFKARQQQDSQPMHERLFGKPAEPEEPSDRPLGDGDGGKGEEAGRYEWGPHGRTPVWTDEEFQRVMAGEELNPNQKENE
jgi:hypothetical protein